MVRGRWLHNSGGREKASGKMWGSSVAEDAAAEAARESSLFFLWFSHWGSRSVRCSNMRDFETPLGCLGCVPGGYGLEARESATGRDRSYSDHAYSRMHLGVRY
jgi:hypothetical protein